jgi:hypothetical protein
MQNSNITLGDRKFEDEDDDESLRKAGPLKGEK